MTYFYFQTFLLLILAYLLGSLAGCFMRKFFPADHVTSPRPADVAVATGRTGAGLGAALGTAGAATGAAIAAGGRNTGETVGNGGYIPAVQPEIRTPVIQTPITPTIPKTTVPQHIPVPTPPPAPVADKMTWEHQQTQTKVVQADDSDFLTEKRTNIPSYSTHSTSIGKSVTSSDDLTKIIGVGSILALKLNKAGITRFEQIANWNQRDIQNINRQLEFSGRVEREDWIGQASRLMSGQAPVVDGTTAHIGTAQKKTSFPSAQEDLHLDAVSSLSLPVSGQPDDLKRIAGVGVVLEEQLNAMGYTHYEHIQNLTPYDIRKISERLEFTGRIEREDWMGQAERLNAHR